MAEVNFGASQLRSEALAEFNNNVNIKSRQFPDHIPEILVEVLSHSPSHSSLFGDVTRNCAVREDKGRMGALDACTCNFSSFGLLLCFPCRSRHSISVA
jgi:hypothetical protein